MQKTIKSKTERGILKLLMAFQLSLAILGSNLSLAGEALIWNLVTLSGDGEANRAFSTCYLFEDLKTRILPLDGETTHIAKYADSLQADIRSIGNYDGKEFYDVIQKFRLRDYPDPTHISYVKLLGFN